MNSDTIQGNWKQLKGKIKEQWGKLTDDDLTVINGKAEQLVENFRNDTVTPRTKPKRRSSVSGRNGKSPPVERNIPDRHRRIKSLCQPGCCWGGSGTVALFL